jgi:hypothetical protein
MLLYQLKRRRRKKIELQIFSFTEHHVMQLISLEVFQNVDADH